MSSYWYTALQTTDYFTSLFLVHLVLYNMVDLSRISVFRGGMSLKF